MIFASATLRWIERFPRPSPFRANVLGLVTGDDTTLTQKEDSMLKTASMAEVIEQEAAKYSAPNAELYDFGGGCTIYPVPDLANTTGYLKDFMIAVIDYNSAAPLKYLRCDISPENTEEELREKVKKTFEDFKQGKTTQETQ